MVRLHQTGITVYAPRGHLAGLTICDNTIIRKSTSTVTTFYSLQIGTYNTNATERYTLSSTFEQPAEDATVGSITFTVDPNLMVGAILHIGDSTAVGGRYEVTANDSEVYTLRRLKWAISTNTGLDTTFDDPIPDDCVQIIGEIRKGVIANNSLQGQMRFDWCTNTIVANNHCSKETENQAMLLVDCYDMDIKDNTLEDGRIEFQKSNTGRCTGNVFGEPSSTTGLDTAKGTYQRLGT